MYSQEGHLAEAAECFCRRVYGGSGDQDRGLDQGVR